MTTQISWLHLTDLHLGIEDDSWLWPGIKHDVFRDLDLLRAESGGWDLVFFTGDLTQAGTQKEFERLTIELQELWQVLSKGGPTPQLCVVPGNHDLTRPEPMKSVTRAMTQLWWQDEAMRNAFWRNGDTDQRVAVSTAFENYSSWLAGSPVPILPHTKGILPGDFAATFEKNGIRLGIAGLNTAFLQVVDGDFIGKLDLHVRQLQAVCERDVARWVSERDAALLLTHHPPPG